MEIRQEVEKSRNDMISSLKRLIAIRSVGEKGEGGYPFGIGVHKCLTECLTLAQQMGFTTVNVDNMLGYCEYGSGEEMVAVLGHLDVVPEGDGWTHAPYGGEEEGGRIYGRGTIDNKGPAIASLYALKAVKDAGIPLNRRVRIFFGLNEETGSEDVKYYLAHQGEVPVMGFTPDGEFPLINGEKGIVNVVYVKKIPKEEGTLSGSVMVKEIHGGTAVNVVPADASAEISKKMQRDGNGQAEPEVFYIHSNVKAEGISAHASTPEKGENAIGRLLLYLNECELSGDMKETVAFLCKYFGTAWNGEQLGIKMRDEISGDLTINLGHLKFDGQMLRLGINLRYPVTGSYEACVPRLEELMHEAGFITEELIHKKSLYMAPDSPLVKTLSSVYEEQTGQPAVLKCIGGGTYAKMMPNILAFGPVFPGDPICEHMPDEYIETEKLIKLTSIIAHAISRMAGEDDWQKEDRE